MALAITSLLTACAFGYYAYTSNSIVLWLVTAVIGFISFSNFIAYASKRAAQTDSHASAPQPVQKLVPRHSSAISAPSAYHDPVEDANVSRGEVPTLSELREKHVDAPLFILPSYTVIDLETTGLNAQTCEIIEVAAIRVRNGEIIDQFSTLVKPIKEISAEITSITGITNEMVACAQVIEEALPKALDFIGDDCVMGHNVSFDIRFIEAQAIKANMQIRFRTSIDTLSMSRMLYPGESHKLQDLVEKFDIPINSAHRALGDVKSTKLVFDAMCLDMRRRRLEPKYYIRQDTYDPPETASPAQLAWLRGDELRKEGKLEEALSMFDEAEHLGYIYQDLYLSRAMVFRKQKNLDAEIDAIKEGIRVAKDHKLNPALLAERLEKTLSRKEKQLASQAADQEKARVREEKKLARQTKQAAQQKEGKPIREKSGQTRPMLQIAEDGSIVRRFDSVADASRSTGINPKSIRDAASGVQKHAGGFKWRYAYDAQE